MFLTNSNSTIIFESFKNAWISLCKTEEDCTGYVNLIRLFYFLILILAIKVFCCLSICFFAMIVAMLDYLKSIFVQYSEDSNSFEYSNSSIFSSFNTSPTAPPAYNAPYNTSASTLNQLSHDGLLRTQGEEHYTVTLV